MEHVTTTSRLKVGDAAVEGVLGGIAAGVAMALFILVVGMLGGVSPTVILGYFDVREGASPAVGLMTHLAVSAVYGGVFGMLWWGARRTLKNPLPRWALIAAGLAYGLGIFVMAEWVVLPRLGSALTQIAVWMFALAHLIYGAVLAWVLARREN